MYGALTALRIMDVCGSWYQGLACKLAFGRVAASQRCERRVERMHGVPQSLHQAVSQAICAHLWEAESSSRHHLHIAWHSCLNCSQVSAKLSSFGVLKLLGIGVWERLILQGRVLSSTQDLLRRDKAARLTMQLLACSDPSSRRRRHCPDSASRATPVTGALQSTSTPTRWHAASMRSRTSLHVTCTESAT